MYTYIPDAVARCWRSHGYTYICARVVDVLLYLFWHWSAGAQDQIPTGVTQKARPSCLRHALSNAPRGQELEVRVQFRPAICSHQRCSSKLNQSLVGLARTVFDLRLFRVIAIVVTEADEACWWLLRWKALENNQRLCVTIAIESFQALDDSNVAVSRHLTREEPLHQMRLCHRPEKLDQKSRINMQVTIEHHPRT